MSLVLKAISCVIVVAALFYYNQMMALNAELAEANEAVEQMSAAAMSAGGAVSSGGAVLADAQAAGGGSAQSDDAQAEAGGAAASPEQESRYKDGTYSGTAQGYGGPVTTELTIKDGYIVGIEITSADGEDAAYYNMCMGILDEIASTQGTDVDTVSGATYTSKGIIGGAKKALAKAEKK
ncbi:MAG: FMN-binding protein [Clostridiales Family XIII bacterium]|jgi:uncharacterized protein with FMN-binding domain|nr:FMN-binding protein [Clostridiales Family XIII bacterium]